MRHYQALDDLAERDDFEAMMMKQMRVTKICVRSIPASAGAASTGEASDIIGCG